MTDSPFGVVSSLVSSLVNLRLLDVGSGDGSFARVVVDAGARVTGIDPNAKAVLKAKSAVPGARFDTGFAENLPYDDCSFDIVVFVNALHHVPKFAMERALLEAARVLHSSGFLVVIEPLTSGSFFEALRIVEDETDVRMAAQAALAGAVSNGLLRQVRCVSYVRREIFDSADRFLERVIAVDPARQGMARARQMEVNETINRAAIRLDNGQLAFDQPIKADVLTKP